MAGKALHDITATATQWSCTCGRYGVFITQEDAQAWHGVCPGESVGRSVRVPGELWAEAMAKATREGKTLSDLIRQWMEAYVGEPHIHEWVSEPDGSIGGLPAFVASCWCGEQTPRYTDTLGHELARRLR